MTTERPENAASAAGRASRTGASAIREALRDAMANDPAIRVLGDAVGRAGGVGGSTAGLQAEFPGRVLDLPVADRGTVGLALGLALGGQKPVVELADTSRLPAVLEVLAHAGSVARRGEHPATLVVRVPYGTEATGLDQPAGRFVADLDGVSVLCPSSPSMAAGLLRHALGGRGPTVVLEPRGLYTDRGPVDDAPVTGAARLLRTGAHVTLAAWGPSVAVALGAADALAREGVEADVIDLVSLAPLDRAAIGARVRATGRLVVVHPDDAALARHVREAGLDEAFLYLEAPLGESPAEGERVLRAAREAVHY